MKKDEIKTDRQRVEYCQNIQDDEEVYNKIESPFQILNYFQNVKFRDELHKKFQDKIEKMKNENHPYNETLLEEIKEAIEDLSEELKKKLI